jgi:flagellar biosynthesis/type III secretory pathway protein FliH
MGTPSAAFAALSRRREFHGMETGNAPRGSSAHQPLPVQRGATAPGAVGRSGTDAAGEASSVTEPPPPTREELAAADQARRRAEQALVASQAEVARLRAQIEKERAQVRELSEAFEQGLAETREELRAGYARLVLVGVRRLVGAMESREAVFLARLQEVADQLVLEPEVVLRVAPRNKGTAEIAAFGRPGWLVEVDAGMDGGCVALCRNATVDARVETALAGLERALEAWVQDDGQAGAER